MMNGFGGRMQEEAKTKLGSTANVRSCSGWRWRYLDTSSELLLYGQRPIDGSISMQDSQQLSAPPEHF